jgi:adenylate kinase family enzyme
MPYTSRSPQLIYRDPLATERDARRDARAHARTEKRMLDGFDPADSVTPAADTAILAAVPVLDAADPLPRRPRRILVAGTSGSGKTTLAGRIAAVLDVPHVEIDSLFHGPSWTRRPSFDEDVRRFSSGPCWVTEWQYDSVRACLAERADLLVWLDLPLRTVMRRVVRRTMVRRLLRQILWNGNIEPPLRTIFTDGEHIVRWAWKTHDRTGARVDNLLNRRPELTVVRLRNGSAVDRWLRGPLHRIQGTGR